MRMMIYGALAFGLIVGQGKATELAIEVSAVRLSWLAESNNVYQVQAKSAELDWTPLATVQGNGSNITFETPVETGRRFFRLEKLTNLQMSLVGYYPFNRNASDESGSDNHATLVNGTAFTTNRFGASERAVSLMAVNQFVETSSANGFPIATQDFTVSMWVSAAAENRTIGDSHSILFSNFSADDFQLDLYWNVENRVEIQFHTGGLKNQGPADCATPALDWAINQWYNVQIVRENNVLKIYRDGMLHGESETTQGNDAPSSQRHLQFGYRTPNAGHQFYGNLDDIRIFNRALTADELRVLREIKE